jgi:membrane protein
MLKQFILLMRETIREWTEDGAAGVAAALAYYTIFSLAPLLIIIALVVGAFLDEKTIEQDILGNVEMTVGRDAAETLRNLLTTEDGTRSRSDVVGTIIWFSVMLWGASGIFAQLQKALNKIWEVRGKPGRSPLVFVKDRLLSFVVVIFAAAILLATMVINTGLSTLLVKNTAIAQSVYIVRPLQVLVTLGMVTVLFATLFKVLPDVMIRWKDVWVGAAFTAVLFILGQFAVGLYIANANVGTVFGAAGSLTVILVWIYYSAQILLFGAEFTEVWARHHGVRLQPDGDAVWSNQMQADAEHARARELRARRQPTAAPQLSVQAADGETKDA